MDVLAILRGTLTLSAGTEALANIELPEGVNQWPDLVFSWVRPKDPANNIAFYWAAFAIGDRATIEDDSLEAYRGLGHFTFTYTCAADTQVEFQFVFTSYPEGPPHIIDYYETS